LENFWRLAAWYSGGFIENEIRNTGNLVLRPPVLGSLFHILYTICTFKISSGSILIKSSIFGDRGQEIDVGDVFLLFEVSLEKLFDQSILSLKSTDRVGPFH
jgi:hypothetical protein